MYLPLGVPDNCSHTSYGYGQKRNPASLTLYVEVKSLDQPYSSIISDKYLFKQSIQQNLFQISLSTN